MGSDQLQTQGESRSFLTPPGSRSLLPSALAQDAHHHGDVLWRCGDASFRGVPGMGTPGESKKDCGNDFLGPSNGERTRVGGSHRIHPSAYLVHK